jgi:hypothetical protein
LGALKGVDAVKFDCKTATVTMKPGATIAAETAEKALRDAGFGMKEFSGGPAPHLLVARARIRAKEPAGAQPGAAALATLAAELPRELPALGEAFVEPDGRLTALSKKDAQLELQPLAAALAAALARRGLAAEGMETLRWPQGAAGYFAALRAPRDAAARGKARAAIEGIETVLAAIDRGDGGSWVVFTREPCANLEARLREALARAGLELVRVGPR